MTFGNHNSPKRTLALAVAAMLLLPPGGGLLSVARAQDPGPVGQAAPAPPSAPSPSAALRIPVAPVQAGPIHTVLLFPFANALSAPGAASGFNVDVVGARVEDAIKLRLNEIGRLKANSFSPTLPQIQRALSEPSATGEGVTENDLAPPYTSAVRGQRVSDQIGTDGYLLGTIEALSISPTTRGVNLTVSATLYSSATGGPVKVLAYTGHGVSYNAADDPDMLLQSAINDAAGHIVSALDAQSGQPQRLRAADVRQGHRHNNTGTVILGILLAVGLGFALSGHHHHNGGGGGGTPTITTPTGPGIPAPPNLGAGLGGTTTGTITGTGTLQPPPIPTQ